MDDLMNRVGALIEGHVKAEVASRRELVENECETRLVTLFGVTDPRDIVESVERTVKERDELRERVERLRDACSTAYRTQNGAEADRDKLREQVQALELKLLEVRKVVADDAPVEVDGFRVGDLVRHTAWVGEHREIKSFGKGGDGALYAYFGAYEGGWLPSNLRRKPVEVGDTVRFDGSPPKTKWVVRSMKENKNGESICWFDGERFARQSECIAVAP